MMEDERDAMWLHVAAMDPDDAVREIYEAMEATRRAKLSEAH